MTTFPFDPIARWWVNARAINRSYDSLITALEKGVTKAERTFAKRHTDKYHAIWTHTIGIEIWSQKKVATLLGEPDGAEDYDPYRPPKDTAWDDLLPLFKQARQDTIALAKRLAEAKLANNAVVHHKGWGNLTAKGWLLYIETHTDIEFDKIF
jgi:hypothetical protein